LRQVYVVVGKWFSLSWGLTREEGFLRVAGKGEIQGSLRFGGKSAASGRDDVGFSSGREEGKSKGDRRSLRFAAG
jgi:hypothetical protein